MRNAGLDEVKAGIKIARRNIDNLRYPGPGLTLDHSILHSPTWGNPINSTFKTYPELAHSHHLLCSHPILNNHHLLSGEWQLSPNRSLYNLACYSHFLHSSLSTFQKESCHVTPLLKILQWKTSNRIKSKVSINGLLDTPREQSGPLLPLFFSTSFILVFSSCSVHTGLLMVS